MLLFFGLLNQTTRPGAIIVGVLGPPVLYVFGSFVYDLQCGRQIQTRH